MFGNRFAIITGNDYPEFVKIILGIFKNETIWQERNYFERIENWSKSWTFIRLSVQDLISLKQPDYKNNKVSSDYLYCSFFLCTTSQKTTGSNDLPKWMKYKKCRSEKQIPFVCIKFVILN